MWCGVCGAAGDESLSPGVKACTDVLGLTLMMVRAVAVEVNYQ